MASAGELRSGKNFERFARVIELIQTMNHRKPSEVLRILRDHTPTISPTRGEMKRWSGPCGDAGRLAETTGPPTEQVQTQWVFK
jgi:hypothetical protein